MNNDECFQQLFYCAPLPNQCQYCGTADTESHGPWRIHCWRFRDGLRIEAGRLTLWVWILVQWVRMLKKCCWVKVDGWYWVTSWERFCLWRRERESCSSDIWRKWVLGLDVDTWKMKRMYEMRMRFKKMVKKLKTKIIKGEDRHTWNPRKQAGCSVRPGRLYEWVECVRE